MAPLPLRFLHSIYIYANLPFCEFTAQARGREASRPPQAQIFLVAAILPLLLKRDGAWTIHNYVLYLGDLDVVLEMWFCLMDNYCIGTIVAPYEIYVPFVVIIYIF